MSLSPAERYAISREQRRKPRLVEFASRLGFDLDPFQRAGCAALDDGRSVLVAAPTGAGKTVVAEFAVFLAMQEPGEKVFYTTPIKALSNQKYQELADEWGADEVGLLTGDTNVNSSARIVVMTTEVLRNMLYADSPLLDRLAYVVMDEVHYLADRFRGAVWEEVIIHLPEQVRLVSLSATVSNAEEFGDWLQAVRGDVSVVVSEHRPVPLWQHMMVGRGMYDLFVGESSDPSNAPDGAAEALRDAAPARVNPELLQAIANLSRRSYDTDRFPPRGRGRRSPGGGPGGRGMARSPGLGGGRPGGGATRAEVLERLEREGLLPAITFIFSRVGCDAAVGQLLAQNVRLVPDDEGERIRRVVEGGV